MNKKCIIGIMMLLLMCVSITGCVFKGSKDFTKTTNNRLLPIETKTDLYYDKDTKIVYLIFNEQSGYAGYGYMSPYYSENGKLYRYDVKLKELEEITPEERK